MLAPPAQRRSTLAALEPRLCFASLLGFEYAGPTTIHPGSTLSIEYDISGGSPGNPEAGELELYLSKDAVFDAGDLLVARPTFSVEGTQSFEDDVNPPRAAGPPGTRHVPRHPEAGLDHACRP